MSAAFGYLLRDRGCTKVRFKLHYWPVYLRWGTALLTCVGIVLALPAAMSRTSWLAAGGGCGFVAFFYWKHKGARRFGKIAGYSRWILTVMLALCVLGGIGMYRLKKDSADGRALTWKIALQTAIHHPLGVGIGYFSGSYGHEQADYFVSGKGSEQEQHVAGNPEYGFNDYLQIAVEQGVIPLTLFLGIMIYNVYAGIRRRRIAATASLVALLIAATASYPFSVLPFLTVTAFLSARIHSETSDRKERSESDSKFSRFQTCKFPYSLILPGIFLLIVAGCLYNRYPTYPAYRQWGRSKALYHAGAYGSGAEAYAPLYPLLADQLDFLFEYAQCLSKSGRYAESNAVLEKAVKIRCDPMLYNVMGRNCQSLRRYAEAEACFLKAAHIVPVRIYPWYLLANLYVETGDPLSTDDESLIGEITKIVHHENYIYVTDRFALYRFTEDGLFSGKIDKRGGGPDEYVAISDFEIESTDKVWILCRSSQTLNQYSWSGALNKKIKFNFWAAKMHLISSGKMCLYIGNERDENNQHQVKVIDLNTENVLNNFLEIDGKKAKYLHVNSLFHFCKKEDGLCYFYNIFDDYIIPCLKNG